MIKKEMAQLLEQTEPGGCSAGTDMPQTKNHDESIARPATEVKKIDDLVSLRTVKNLAVNDMVSVVQTLYPKYDRYLLSKCENGNKYGIDIRPDAFRALLEKFAPETVKRRANDKKRNANRIQARLTDTVVARLKKALNEDGFTIQGWLEKQVYDYLNGRCKKVE